MIGTFWFVRLDEGELWKNDYRLQSRVNRVKSTYLARECAMIVDIMIKSTSCDSLVLILC